MPFTKHIIEPINISQCPLPVGEPNELECLSNLTLANVIRQLSSLGLHATRIFDELTKDAVQINARSQILNQRIETLKVKCSQLDIQNEEVSLADFQTKKQFKSSIKIDQQVVSRKTMPDAMKIMYENADPAPELYKLNPYRTDGKDCMKFYTDPEFFFNIWCNELMKDNETRKIEKKRRRTKNGNSNEQKQTNKSNPSQQQLVQVQQNQKTNTSNQIYQRPEVSLNVPPPPPLPNSHQFSNNQNQSLNLPYDEMSYQQNQVILRQTLSEQNQQNYAQVQNQIYASNKMSITMVSQHHHQHQQGNFDMTDKQLPAPPPSIYNNGNSNNNNNNNNTTVYQAYNQAKITIHQQHQQASNLIKHNNINNNNSNGNSQSCYNERPMLPPPPIPDASHMSDLQQIQQQLIKKYDDSRISVNDINTNNNFNIDLSNQNGNHDFLPPPPSPPFFNETTNKLVTLTQAMTNLNMMHNSNHHQNHINNTENVMTDSAMFDMPLPPPPIELQQENNHNNNQSNGHQEKNGGIFNGNGFLPPPPPLPPLVESDTASSSSSSLTNVMINHGPTNGQSESNKTAPLAPPEEIKSTRSYLDDITKRRFVLKPTVKDNLQERPKTTPNGSNGNQGSDENNRDTIQPFVNNSDVAAIIDFIRKFRPHVCDSSDDEENSDWDD